MKEQWEQLLAELRRLWRVLVDNGYIGWAMWLLEKAAKPANA
jgi:hypothetical protein